MGKVINAFIGAICMLSGVILYGFVHLVAGSYLPNMRGWSSPPGKFLTALADTAGTIPALIAVILFAVGIFSLYKGYERG